MAQTIATINVVRLIPPSDGAAEGEADVAAACVGVVEDDEDEEAGVSLAAAELRSAAAELTEPMKSLRGLTLVVACDMTTPAMLARSSAAECRWLCCILPGGGYEVTIVERED